MNTQFRELENLAWHHVLEGWSMEDIELIYGKKVPEEFQDMCERIGREYDEYIDRMKAREEDLR